MELFYDRWRMWLTAIKAMQAMSSDSEAQHQAMLARTMQARIYALTPDAVECVLNTLDRLNPLPPFTTLTPYMWIELEKGRLEDRLGQTVALFVFPRDDDTTSGIYDCLTYDAALHQFRAYSFDDHSSHWTAHQMACSQTCYFARNQGMPVSSEEVERRSADGCLCASEFRHWARVLCTTLFLLGAEGADHVIVERSDKERRRIARTGGPRILSSQLAARYTRISLSKRFHVRRTEGTLQIDEEAVGDEVNTSNDLPVTLTTVAGHYRLLIPGPGKPWRGESARVVFVRSHQRKVRAGGMIRYRVDP